VKTVHYLVVLALLCGTALILHRRGDTDKVPDSQPLDLLPRAIGTWDGKDVPLQSYALDVLGKGVFLNRTYLPQGVSPMQAAATPGEGPVGLFIGYFPTQRTGQAIHSPQNCLPGSGWTFEAKGTTTLKNPKGREDQVGEYLISNGKARDVVLYWYRSQGRTMASDYVAKWYTLLDSIRYQRTDAALIRVITPILPGENQGQAQKRVVDFAERLTPLLPAYIPD
jgi:EpsI family protein